MLSKVGVYGFLRIVLPVMPEGSQHWQELFIILAVFSILYGSILAFSQDNIRLVLAYSSIAQLGFIVLGIFAFEDKGAQGALFQMLNHGLVVVPLFLIVGVIALRAGGSESLTELGGMAFRAPVLAGLFLVTSLATLAMPGSANFVGEILILFGTFEDKLVYGLVASVRAARGGLHDPALPGHDARPRGAVVASREIDAVNLAAGPTGRDRDRARRVPAVRNGAHRAGHWGMTPARTRDLGDPMSTLLAAAQVQAPEIDYKELAAVRAHGRLGDRADGRPPALALREAHRRAGAHGGRAVHGHRPHDLDLGAGTATRSSRARWAWTRSRSASRCSSTWRGS